MRHKGVWKSELALGPNAELFSVFLGTALKGPLFHGTAGRVGFTHSLRLRHISLKGWLASRYGGTSESEDRCEYVPEKSRGRAAL
jgi:hypothetical protein